MTSDRVREAIGRRALIGAVRRASGRRGEPAARPHGALYRAADAIDRFVRTNPVLRLVGLLFAVLSGVVLVATGVQIFLDYQYRQEDRVARAWETLIRPVGGNTGKAEALSFLLQSGISVDGLDLSCAAAGSYDRAERRCVRPPILSNVGFRPREENGWFQDVNLADTMIYEFYVGSGAISGLDLRGTEIGVFFVEKAFVSGHLAAARIGTCVVERSTVQLDLFEAELPVGCMVDGVIVDATEEGLARIGPGKIMARADRPPLLTDGNDARNELLRPAVEAGVLRLCDPEAPAGDCRTLTYEQAAARYPALYPDLAQR